MKSGEKWCPDCDACMTARMNADACRLLSSPTQHIAAHVSRKGPDGEARAGRGAGQGQEEGRQEPEHGGTKKRVMGKTTVDLWTL
jgi:hypothetical protein